MRRTILLVTSLLTLGIFKSLQAGPPVLPPSEQDSLALVALYDSTDGANWTDNTNWLTSATLADWHGVTVTDGRVTGLNLYDNGLTGVLPVSLGNLTNLTGLSLGNDALTGTIPSTIGNLNNLTDLSLAVTQLEGSVPTEISNLTSLNSLVLSVNQLVDLPDLSSLTALQLLHIYNNRFTFEDIEPNLNVASSSFIFSPQDSVGVERDTVVILGDPFTLHVPVGGTANHYRWTRNWTELPNDTTDTYTVLSAVPEHAGDYSLRITNSLVTDLTLYSRPIHVSVEYPGSIEQDSLALVALYDSTGGPSWSNQGGWLTDPLANWYGVTVTEGRVTALSLYEHGLTGALPAAIGDLLALESLHLYRDHLTSIPDEIGNLVNMRELWLMENDLTSIPAGIGGLVNLEDLYLYDNQLTDLPPEIISLVSLERLGLAENPFTTIPSVIFELPNLMQLDMYECEIAGAVPAGISNLVNLEHLSLYNNNIISIPPEIGTMINLLSLGLNNNLLMDIPPEIGDLANLNTLSLSGNQLTTLPTDIGTLSNLEYLYLEGNRLSSLPTELGNLTSLKGLDLIDNQLTSIPAGIFGLTNLEYLELRNNRITGAIPPEIGGLTNLRTLGLNDNELTGAIPDEIGDMTNLAYLLLINNQLSGAIPDTIGSLGKLDQLLLSNNQLSGTTPATIGRDTSLTTLWLDGNELTGAVPEEITNLFHLYYLTLNNNRLEDLPDLSAMPVLMDLHLENNRFTFEDIEPNVNLAAASEPLPSYYYSPQDSVGEEQKFVVAAGQSITLEGDMGGTATEYQWKRNGVDIDGATNPSYTISSVQHSDGGTYHLHATNTIATGLELISRPIHLLGPNNPPVAGADSSITIPSGLSFSISLEGMGATDSDGDTLMIKEVLTTGFGSIRNVDERMFVYQSMHGYTGLDTIDYIISDGLLGTATGRVLITLTDDILDPPITISQTFGGKKDDHGYSVQQTTDGGYIIAGHTESYGAGDVDAWLIKTTYLGDISWTKTFGGSSIDISYSVQQTSDGGYILAGETESSGAGDADAWLIKTDASGVLSWAKTYGGSDYDNAISVQQTSEGGYILAGQTDSYGAGGSDAWLVKTTASGDTSWTKIFGGSEFENIISVQQTADGGYILAGQTASFGAGETDIWLIKTDASGGTTWTKTFGGSDKDIGYCVQQTSDGGYILAGQTGSPEYFSADAWIIKTNADGETAWTKTIGEGGNDGAHSILEVPGRGYVVAGYVDFGWRKSDFWLIGTDALGNTAWERSQPMGGYGEDQAFAVNLTWNNDVIVLGTTGSFGSGGDDVWLLKIEEESIQGIEDHNVQIPHEFALNQNYPNPFNPSTTIRYDLPEAAEVTLVIYDILGREVVQLVQGRMEAGYQGVVWNGRTASGREVPSGIYIAHILTPEYSKSMKMVLLK
ncbi:leucine-rich repeat domain-containing protein [Candidatus Neomarinimicrobiota bacterium]